MGTVLEERFIQAFRSYEVADRCQVIRVLEQLYRDGSVRHLDGLWVRYSDWWFHVSPSNAGPVLELNVGAKSRLLLEEKQQALAAQIEEIGRK